MPAIAVNCVPDTVSATSDNPNALQGNGKELRRQQQQQQPDDKTLSWSSLLLTTSASASALLDADGKRKLAHLLFQHHVSSSITTADADAADEESSGSAAGAFPMDRTASLCTDNGYIERVLKSIESTVVMDGSSRRCSEVLSDYDGRMDSLSGGFLRFVRSMMPNQPAARVADFNENISYVMLGQRRLEQFGASDSDLSQSDSESDDTDSDVPGSTTILVKEFERKLQRAVGDVDIDYQGSFLKTEQTVPQPAHVDFTWEYLDQVTDELYIGFFPLSEDGMFLQLWKNEDPFGSESGQVVFIPFGKLLIMPAATVHGGGFRTSSSGNPRFHLYISSRGRALPDHQQNKYTERNNKARELCERLVDAPCLDALVGSLFQ